MIFHYQVILYLNDYLVTGFSKKLAQRITTEGLIMCWLISRIMEKVQSTHGAVPLARARVRQVQWEFLASCREEEDYDIYMFLSAKALEGLKFWENLPTGLYSPITLPSSSQFFDMDASDSGIGIY